MYARGVANQTRTRMGSGRDDVSRIPQFSSIFYGGIPNVSVVSAV